MILYRFGRILLNTVESAGAETARDKQPLGSEGIQLPLEGHSGGASPGNKKDIK